MIIDAEKYYYHELVCTFYCEKDIQFCQQFFNTFLILFWPSTIMEAFYCITINP